MDSLELKAPEQDLESHIAAIRHISIADQPNFRKAKINKASGFEKTITANKSALQAIKSHNKK